MHIFEHSFWFEFVDVVAVHGRVVVDSVEEAVYCLAFGDRIFASKEGVFVRLDGDGTDG